MSQNIIEVIILSVFFCVYLKYFFLLCIVGLMHVHNKLVDPVLSIKDQWHSEDGWKFLDPTRMDIIITVVLFYTEELLTPCQLCTMTMYLVNSWTLKDFG